MTNTAERKEKADRQARPHLMRAASRPVRPICQPLQPTLLIPRKPPVHALPANPKPARHLGHRHPTQHRQHRLIPLLRHADLHEHPAHLLARHKPDQDRAARCRTSAEASVAHQPKPRRKSAGARMSHIRRSNTQDWWGGWGSNPRPADYEGGRGQFTIVRDCSDHAVCTRPAPGGRW